jgi:hypothetical protein
MTTITSCTYYSICGLERRSPSVPGTAYIPDQREGVGVALHVLSAPSQSHSLGRLPPIECHFSRSSTASQARAYAHQVSAVRGAMPRTSAHWARGLGPSIG